ncbi:CDP-glycerol glycerophosphotransferase family protein [Listeria grayi]|uniref:CDP-glycerol glycerophosphotransferase family protein n=1 Tax=Listeria grayi TaxID=1641 RepID=UPI0004B73901|nr:CDP-glycerol glycerophosphotransferase family protein [Listeria grayi]
MKDILLLKIKKVILFAPTFRGGGRKSAHYPYEYLNLRKIYENLQGNDYVFLFKVHFNTLNKINIPYELSDFFYDVSDYRDINDLMLISDLLITDYSSVCFEFSLLDKPMLFFSPDVENYVSQRGFYYEYKELIPGKLVQSTTQLITAILENDFEFKKSRYF